MNAAREVSTRSRCDANRLRGPGLPPETQSNGESDRLADADQERESHDVGEDACAFLQASTVCVISTLLPDGSPHASAMHFAPKGEVGCLYICINKRSKSRSLPTRWSRLHCRCTVAWRSCKAADSTRGRTSSTPGFPLRHNTKTIRVRSSRISHRRGYGTPTVRRKSNSSYAAFLLT